MNNLKEVLKGKCISFEGGEGSGKGTVVKKLQNVLKEENIDSVFTREPGGTDISEDIREIIISMDNKHMNPRTEALLYAAARVENLEEVVFPSLKEGKTVILDRYVDSSYVYQGYSRGLNLQDIIDINNFATNNFFPDLTILLDLDPEVGIDRIMTNRADEINRLDLEGLSFHKKVRAGYLDLAKNNKDRFVIIDASQAPEKVFDDVLDAIKNHFN